MGKKQKTAKARKSPASKATTNQAPTSAVPSASGHGSTTGSVGSLVRGLISYGAAPRVIETILAFSSVEVLLAFRLTCRRARDHADLVFSHRVGMWMEDRDIVFGTHGDDDLETYKRQRIPAFHSRGSIFLETVTPLGTQNALLGLRLDHHVTRFSVPAGDAAWFAAFLRGVHTVDLHGGNSATLQPGAAARSEPDAWGRVLVAGVRVPVLHFFPACHETETPYATAVPFCAQTVAVFHNLHEPHADMRRSSLAWPRWAPECARVVHHVKLLHQQQLDPAQLAGSALEFLQYPATVTKVTTVLWVAAATRPGQRAGQGPPLPATGANPAAVHRHTLVAVISRICGYYTSAIEWEFARLNTVAVFDDGMLVPPAQVPGMVVRYMAVVSSGKGQHGEHPPTMQEVLQKEKAICSHVRFVNLVE